MLRTRKHPTMRSRPYAVAVRDLRHHVEERKLDRCAMLALVHGFERILDAVYGYGFKSERFRADAGYEWKTYCNVAEEEQAQRWIAFCKETGREP